MYDQNKYDNKLKHVHSIEVNSNNIIKIILNKFRKKFTMLIEDYRSNKSLLRLTYINNRLLSYHLVILSKSRINK